jgi:hypothetical protein
MQRWRRKHSNRPTDPHRRNAGHLRPREGNVTHSHTQPDPNQTTKGVCYEMKLQIFDLSWGTLNIPTS